MQHYECVKYRRVYRLRIIFHFFIFFYVYECAQGPAVEWDSHTHTIFYPVVCLEFSTSSDFGSFRLFVVFGAFLKIESEFVGFFHFLVLRVCVVYPPHFSLICVCWYYVGSSVKVFGFKSEFLYACMWIEK